jgi:hypothetical protein
MRNRDFQPESNIVEGVFWFFILLGLNVASALFLVFSTHELLLEKSTLAGLNEVESIALRELGMEFPNNLAKPSQ